MTCAGEILQLPLPTILDAYFRFLTTPGVRRGKNAFSPPHIGVIALSSAGSRVAITGGTLFHRARKQAIKTPPPQSPTRFHISHLISPNNWTCSPAIILSDPRFHGSPAILFHKATKAGGGVPHDCKAKDQVYSNVRPGPLPVGISRGKAASKADSAPPMFHSSRALLGMYCLVQGQGCRVLRLLLYITKRQLGAFFAIYIYTLYQILRHQL